MSFAALAKQMSGDKALENDTKMDSTESNNNNRSEGDQVLKVPGFGLDVTSDTPGMKYPSAIKQGWLSNGVTLREKRMLAFIDSITDKPNWESKVFDDAIVAKWREEASAQPAELGGDPVLSEKMFDFCINELKDKAATFKKTGFVNIYDAEVSIVKSDTVVSEALRDALIKAVKVLEDVPNQKKDWHPGSDDKVLDLLHPSLFPVIFGLTKALPTGKVPLEGCISYTGRGELTSKKTKKNSSNEYGNFQWLPTDVQLTDSGAKLLGYINNLHPVHHAEVFKVLEKLVEVAIPLWNECLSGYHKRLRIHFEGTGADDWTYPEGLKYQIPGREGPSSWWDPIAREVGEGKLNEETGELEYEEDDDDDWRYEAAFEEWVHEHRILVQREPREYIPQSELKSKSYYNHVEDDDANDGNDRDDNNGGDGTIANLKEDAPNSTIQVIFKLANIELTPEKPEYDGGTWHVEGALNEGICATAIYYYDQDNITDSHLGFRQALDQEELIMIPEQNEFESLELFLGIEQDGPAVQELGKVLTRKGRMLVFPNCMQHQVQPFSLKDKSKPGYRKILAMFLIDPQRRILSTSNVPPQRRDWWADELRKQQSLDKLPAELFDHTVHMVDDFPISWENALDYRKQLMAERSNMNDETTDCMLSETFSFCEH
ncbi:hypothetical protein jhhlp_001602 [Lomentospora prolificans]|uniref:Uncharacterized protein n=1 Tax=Lomentospora prolificans TaxID=41688 RepID=A0A2N3NIX1_9PEZI|nr:hypothetical protein jhhlp_001602 [Lomentospora prolificans]